MKVTLTILTILTAMLVSQQSMAYRYINEALTCGELAPSREHTENWNEGGSDWLNVWWWPVYCDDNQMKNIAYDLFEGRDYSPNRENLRFLSASWALDVYCRHSSVGKIYAELYLITYTSRGRAKRTPIVNAHGDCSTVQDIEHPVISERPPHRRAVPYPAVNQIPAIQELRNVLSDPNRPNRAKVVARAGKRFYSPGSGQLMIHFGFLNVEMAAYGDSDAVPSASSTGHNTRGESNSQGQEVWEEMSELSDRTRSGYDDWDSMSDLSSEPDIEDYETARDDGGFRRHRRTQGIPRVFDPFRTRSDR